jgi:hypothetical protein
MHNAEVFGGEAGRDVDFAAFGSAIFRHDTPVATPLFCSISVRLLPAVVSVLRSIR